MKFRGCCFQQSVIISNQNSFCLIGKSTQVMFLIDDQKNISHFEMAVYIIQCRAKFYTEKASKVNYNLINK